MALVDIHTHLIPFVDDGINNKSTLLESLDAYKDEGFNKLVSTVHLYNPYVNTRVENIREMGQWVKEEAAKRDIEFFIGSETFIGGMNEVSVLPFLNNCVLIETDYYAAPLFLVHHANDLIKRSYKVILAHIERYRWFNLDSPLVMQLRELGLYFQCNVDAVEQKSVEHLLKEGFVDIIATDNHGDLTLPKRLRALLEGYPAIKVRMDKLFEF
ncbi:MAG: CpsB/CapC family capsule biosynthesis tyrosine phosphatase [Sphaerochaetaceae bacterium]